MTTALRVAEMLRSEGHEVVGTIVGANRGTKVPDFFLRDIGCPVKKYTSPQVGMNKSGRKYSYIVTTIANVFWILVYGVKSGLFLHRTIKRSGADVVINYYDQTYGVTHMVLFLKIPMVCLSHHYTFLLKDYKFAISRFKANFELKMVTSLTCIGSKCIAQSFFPMEDSKKVHVVPPILRKEVLQKRDQVRDDGFILIYLLYDGYIEDILEEHRKYPDIKLHVFVWSNNLPESDGSLEFHHLNDELFLELLCSCKAIISNSGFELPSEAMYFGKPIEAIPGHIEQQCNGGQIVDIGAGIVTDRIDIGALLSFTERYNPLDSFRQWVDSWEDIRLTDLL